MKTEEQPNVSTVCGADAVAQVWAEVLQREDIGQNQNFFDVGGDSLKALEVISRLQASLGIELPLIAFFEDPTIAHLSKVVAELRPAGNVPSNEPGSSAMDESRTMVGQVWSEVLQRENISSSENFFDLGGDSLKALEVISRLQGLLNVDVPLIAFFEDPTIAHLANVVKELRPGAVTPAVVPASAATNEAPLAFGQLQYWLLQQSATSGHLHSNARVFRIRGEFRADVLKRALHEMCKRHQVLGSRIVPGIDEPTQVADPNPEVPLALEDLSGLPEHVRERRSMEIAQEEWRKLVDLAKELPLRARLVRLAEDDHLLVVIIHHVVSDGHSGSIFFEELAAIYDSLLNGTASGLPHLPMQYFEYAAAERSQMQGKRLETELAFWRSYLQGAPSHAALPTDKVRPERPGNSGSTVGTQLASATLAGLKELAQTTGSTLFSVVLSALRILLYRWAGERDTVIGTVSSTRSRAGTERMVGCFVNFLPFRNQIADGETALEVLEREKQSVREAFAHQDCPFLKIVTSATGTGTTDPNPVYNVGLLLQNFPEIKFCGDKFSGELIELESGFALLDLRFITIERHDGLQLDCEFNTELFSTSTVRDLLAAFTGILAELAANPTRPVSEFAIPATLRAQAESARRREQPCTVAITSTFTAELLQAPLAFWMKQLGVRANFRFAPYNQVFQQLLDPLSLVSSNRDGFNIVLLRLTDWVRLEKELPDALKRQKIQSSVREVLRPLQTHQLAVPTFICLCPPEDSYRTQAWSAFFEELEREIASELGSMTGVQRITTQDIFEYYPVENYADDYADKVGHIPYTSDFFAALATTLARRIVAVGSEPKKVIVVDGDGVLWQSEPVNQPLHQALQSLLLKQFEERGMLLCVVSDKPEEFVDGALENGDMPLRPEHFIARRTGLRSLASGLRELAEELQLPLASFVLMSADARRCREVEAQFPDVLTLELPADASQTPEYLRHLWVFDQPGTVAADPRLASANQALARAASELRDVPSIRRAIDAAQLSAREQSVEFVAPRTPVEEMIAGAWADVLKIDRVGAHDNFFALGGHSLLATQVVARVRQLFGLEVPLRAMFEAPTVAQFAERIDSMRRSGSQLDAPRIERVANRDRLPLSFAQQRLWFMDQLEPGSPFYNMPRVVRMQGKLDVGALHRALNQLVERHESLRTTFGVEGSVPYQVIAKKLELPLPVVELADLPETRREERAKELAKEEAQRPFNLATGPVMRAQVLRLAPEEHILLWTMHHIVSDRWSMGIVAEELAAHYSAFVRGEASPLPELAIQYADFAVWQRNWLQGEVLQAELDYWRKQLAGAPPLLELPTDKPRPPELSVRGGVQSVLLSRDYISELTEFSQREGVTLFMTLLSAFQTLLWRYSGQEDVTVGSPIANRTFAEIEPLIGFFVNTLALRGDLSGDPTFRELLARTKETCLHAYAHQDIPFEKLVEELEPERSLSHSPIFQVMFALQNAPMQQMELAGLTMERVPTWTETSMFDMSWFVNEVAAGFLLYVEYASDLFDDATIIRALGHFQRLLRSAVAHPDRRISELGMLDEQERQKVVVEFNDTAADFPRLCIHQLFEHSVERSPDAIAMVCDGQRTSYRELNERANQIAHHLIRLGAGPDLLVGIFMERTPDLLPAILGVLKSGSAYVPLDPSYPRERLQAILSDSKALLVLTQQSLSGQLESDSAKFVCVDSQWLEISRESRENPEVGVSPDNLAYVLFTSGSTGRPKGVALEHHNNVTFVQWAQTVFTREELAGVLFSTSIGFDMSTFEMFITLAAGGKVILAENALYLSALPGKDEVTLINTVPSAMAELVRMNALPESLHTVALAGEALPGSLVEEIYRTGTVKKVYNLYGPTESGYSTWTLVSRGSRVTIGKPIANEQCYVLDKSLHPLPVGVPGELYLAGEGLARGYLGRPDLTAERFISNPFRKDKNARMYKTGDLCRWLADGNIDYLGRIDHQVKLRGFRIELGEIESLLAQHPGVRQCLVMAREDEPGLKRLVGYFVPQEGANPTPDELAHYLKCSLPEYMIPSAFVMLDAFPLTANGKIDRKALPTPEYRQADSENYVAPRNSLEEKLAAIWAEVLRLERVSITDDFFAVGGHSLLAAQVISRLREELGIEIPLKAIFESPKLEVLAARLQGTKRGVEVPAITRISRTEAIRASFAQQRLWFLDQLEPNDPTYNIPWTLKISGTVNLDAIESSLNDIIARHESLRTTFTTIDDEPFQVIHDSVTIPIRRIDLSALPREQREVEAKRLISEEANRAIDLTAPPLMRFTYIQLSDEDHYLVLNVHHILSDRWSMGVISEELAQLYEGTVTGNPATLPELRLQYADYAEWQRRWLQGDALNKQLTYWKEKLNGVPSRLDLPTDRPRQATESLHGDAIYHSLPRNLVDKLKDLSQQRGVTLFMTLLAGFQALLSRYSGQEDLVVGTALGNRNHPDLERIVGLLLNTLPLRTDLSGNPTFTELLARVKETCLGAFAHQDIPFEKLVEELNPERNLAHSPLVQVYFVLQNAPVEELQLKGLKLKRIASGLKTVKGDMSLLMHETADGMEERLEYSTDLFDRTTVERMMGQFSVLLEAAANKPETRLSDLPLLTDAERQRILVDWNSTRVEYDRNCCLHQHIENQVRKTPDAPALVFEQRQLTYRELNARANQLGHHLRRLGVGPNVLVGICAERSLELVVGLLGVMKAGGAYVPLDPDHPRERLTAVIEDAAPPVLLTLAHLEHVLPAGTARVLCLDRDWHMLEKEPKSNPESITAGTDAAYAIFTSGSTGKPKGVPNVHEGIVNRLLWMQHAYQLDASDRVLQKTPYSFDVSVWEFFWPLMTGACLVVARPEGHKDPSYLMEIIQRQRITTMHFVPSMLNIFLEAEGVERCTSLRRVICSGEALAKDTEQRFFQRLQAELHNLYGPTEASVDVTYWSCAPDSGGSSVPIGKPIWNTQIYILDKRLRPVPIGVPGELHIGGIGLARGYLNRPELTAEKFIPDPFSRVGGARLYKTGDLARFLADGNIEYIGRLDHQVKIRGFRIELGEIECVLAKHENVRQCLVLAREDQPGDKRLVAYLIPATNQSVDTDQMRKWLAQHLPEYMVPSAIVTLEEFPLSPNGKVDRKQLPAPVYQEKRAKERRAPATGTEEIICGIWAEVLKLPRVSIDDDFFALGGHSLLATQVISRIRAAFQTNIPLRVLFESPTPAELSQRVDVLVRQKHGMGAPPILPVPRTGPIPLSFAQQRLWFLDQLEPGNPLYNFAYISRIAGPLDLKALENSLNEIVRRHESLRTSFPTVEGIATQFIAPSLKLELQFTDLGNLDSVQDREAEARRLATQEAQKPFNLAAGPLFRASVIKIGTDDHAFVLMMHHIITDRWSVGVLSQELAALYEAEIHAKSHSLPELKIQYADFAVWQRQFLSGEVLTRQLEYWRKQLEGAPAVLDMPTDHPRDGAGHFWGVQHKRPLPRDLINAIATFTRSQRGTVFMGLLSGFQLLLSKLSGQDDVVVGTDLANRNHLETERLIGFFVNLLPIRARVNPGAPFNELFRQVREASLGAMAYQDVPFDKLVEELRPERSLTHNPLVQVLFVMQNTTPVIHEFGGLKMSPLGVSGSSRFDLVLFITDSESHPAAMWFYNPKLFEAATIERMAVSYEHLLSKAFGDPEIRQGKIFEALNELEKQERDQEQKKFRHTSLQKLQQIRNRKTNQN